MYMYQCVWGYVRECILVVVLLAVDTAAFQSPLPASSTCNSPISSHHCNPLAVF